MATQPIPGNYVAPNLLGPYYNAGAPSAGTDEVQALTIDATGGTFQLAYEGRRTSAVTWSATNATLLANLQAALDTLLGTNAVVATAGTLTAGVGTILLTFSGSGFTKNTVSLFTVANNSLTGTATLTIAQTTPGVAATFRRALPGALVIDTTNKIVYVQTGTQGAPTWTKVGVQT